MKAPFSGRFRARSLELLSGTYDCDQLFADIDVADAKKIESPRLGSYSLRP